MSDSAPNRGVLIRRMLAADLDAVLNIERASHHAPWPEELVRRELDHQWSTVLLAFDEPAGGEPVSALRGYLVFWFVHDEIQILNVAVDPAFRRRGYAKALMLAAEKHQGARPAMTATLEVRRSNDAAIGLYRILGYEEVGVRRRYYPDNAEDAVLMTKRLRSE